MKIAAAGASDMADWAALRQALWPTDGADVHAAEMAQIVSAKDEAACFIARAADGAAAGLAEVSLRHEHVNGCTTSPVTFLEGIYVVPQHRRSGVARALVAAAEGWARARGCSEFASDTAHDNLDSRRLHAALGFAETAQVVYFRKGLP